MSTIKMDLEVRMLAGEPRKRLVRRATRSSARHAKTKYQSLVPAGEFCFVLRKARHLLIRAQENTTSRSFVFAQQLEREWNGR